MTRLCERVCLLIACFAPTAAGYDPVLGLQLAYLEKALYCGEEKFNQWDVGGSITHGPKVSASEVRFVTANSTQGAAGVGRMLEPNGCFVAMRGTKGSISSWLDAEFWLTDFKRSSCANCQVDFGFLTNYESLRDGIFSALSEFGCQDQPLYLMGHSLGAAGIHFLAFDALDLGYNLTHLYALEPPRPGNPEFAAALQAKTRGLDTWRVAHYKDIVVHVPTEALHYRHALPEIYYDHESGTHFRKCGVEDTTCSGQWWLWQTTAKDHGWYADINPCTCESDADARNPPALSDIMVV